MLQGRAAPGPAPGVAVAVVSGMMVEMATRMHGASSSSAEEGVAVVDPWEGAVGPWATAKADSGAGAAGVAGAAGAAGEAILVATGKMRRAKR